jgi:hypothetical protein
MIVSAEPVSPQEHRVNHAQTVNDYGQQEAVSVSEPNHKSRLIRRREDARGNWEAYGLGTIFTPKLLRRNVCIWLALLCVESM